MRVPLSWLREYVDVDLTPEALADRLTLLGMEVKGIERLGTGWSRVVVGELLAVERHPNSIAPVADHGPGGRRPADAVDRVRRHQHRGRPAGARRAPGFGAARRPAHRDRAPGGRREPGDAVLGRRAGALLGCRRASSSCPPTRPSACHSRSWSGTRVLDVDVKPNRGDALSIIGLAREVAAATGAPLRWPEIRVAESGDATADHLSRGRPGHAPLPAVRGTLPRRRDASAHRPFAIGRRLLAAGVRPISNVVDASNYVMLELGKPIHTFDAAAITDGRIVVRGGHAGRAPHDARPRRPGARSRCAAHRRPGRTAGHRGRHGRPDQRGLATPPPRSWSSRPSSTR